MFSNKVNTEVTAGKLQDIENISTATHLTLTGVIDARDFFFMRDNMPVLTILDLSGVSVAAYNEYPANAVPNEALYNKTRLRSVVLPIGLESIGASAFYQSANIAKVELPITITTIGNDAFYQNNISNAITIPGSIGSYAFYGNRLLKDVTFTTAAGSNAQVGSYAFFECDLQSLNLPEGVVSIGARAFEYNQNLASLTLPSSLQQIGDYAFTYNSKLTAVSSLSRNPQTVSDYAFYQFGRTGGNVRHNTKLYVPFGTASDYSDTRGWADTLAVALDDPLADFTSCDEGNGFYYFDYHGLCSYAYPEVYDWINNIIESGYAFSAGATEGKASSTVANGLYSEGIEITVTASPLVEDAGYIFDGCRKPIPLPCPLPTAYLLHVTHWQ